MFEHRKLSFGRSLAVRVVVSAVEDVPEFLDGVKLELVVDDIGVNHSVGVALEE